MSKSDWTDVGPITTDDATTEAASLAMGAFVAPFKGRARVAAAGAAAIVWNRTVRPMTYDATETSANVRAILADPSIASADRAAILTYMA